ncbi:MAG: tyrosine-type recombinase/integrase [Ignavibacteria bacterium]|jgi:site-specific recombinase XerD
MNKKEEFIDWLKAELARKEYKPKTIEIYILWLNKLQRYYDSSDIKNISFDQIEQYVVFLKERKNAAARTIHQAIHSFKTVYNDILKMNYDFASISKPKRTIEKPTTLERIEIIELLNNATELRYQLFFALLYSAGLFPSEARELRLKDFDYENRLIVIRSKYFQNNRKTELSSFVEKKLKEYLTQYKPKTFLFEKPSSGKLMDESTFQKAFQKALKNAGINKVVTPKSLKYSYVKHVEEDGIPLQAILKHLNMVAKWRSRTLYFYSKIIEREIKSVPNPLDKIVYTDIEKIDIASIERMLLKVSDPNVKDYILEGIQCINSGVYRAAVIFIWSATMYTLYNKCLSRSKNLLNDAIRRHQPNAPWIDKIEDFAYIKDRTVLDSTTDLSIYDKNQKNVLVECLDLRNKCGHPGNYKPKPIRVAAFLEEVVSIVFSEI